MYFLFILCIGLYFLFEYLYLCSFKFFLLFRFVLSGVYEKKLNFIKWLNKIVKVDFCIYNINIDILFKYIFKV